MTKLILVLLLLYSSFHIHAQKIIEAYLPVYDSVRVGKKDFLPCNEKGYTLVQADSTKGLLICFSESKVDTALAWNKDYFKAAATGQLSVLYICSGRPHDFFFTKKDIDPADVMLSVVLEKHALSGQPIVFFGPGLAGTRALQFIRYYQNGQSSNLLDIMGVALFDSPLDMIRLYKTTYKHLLTSKSTYVEDTQLLYLLKAAFGAKPKSYLTNYLSYSPFSFWDDKDENARFFIRYPIRAYTEPAIEWRLRNELGNTYQSTLPDMTGFIQALQSAGALSADLILLPDRTVSSRKFDDCFALAGKGDFISWCVDLIQSKN
jgi:hypothetical protein